jgi:hypothetical protein
MKVDQSPNKYLHLISIFCVGEAEALPLRECYSRRGNAIVMQFLAAERDWMTEEPWTTNQHLMTWSTAAYQVLAKNRAKPREKN